MSWMYQGAEVRADDWRLVDFKPMHCKGLVVFRSSEAHKQEEQSVHLEQSTLDHAQDGKSIVHCQDLVSNGDYREWLHETHRNGGMNIVTGARTSCLNDYPFSREVFTDIKNKFMLHGSIIRVINRNLSCHFSATLQESLPDGTAARHFTYNCRTAGSWPGDMALSLAFFPDTLTTNALWFGCDLSGSGTPGSGRANINVIRQRLSSYDGQALHPMLLPTMLADVERDRLVRLIRETHSSFIQKVLDLQNRESQQQQLASPSTLTDLSAELQSPRRRLTGVFKIPARKGTDMKSSGKTESSDPTPPIPLHAFPPVSPSLDGKEPSIQLFVKISHLMNGLGNWHTQLLRMIEHVNDLQQMGFGLARTADATDESIDATKSALTSSGLRIRDRLQELVREYDEHMRKCTHIMDSIMLTTQLEIALSSRLEAHSSQQIAVSNLEVAKLARRDGNLMKSIALLGMIFLPGTFVATFFSMDFFDWPKDNKLVSPYIWVYMVVTVTLTSLCLLGFYSCILRKQEGSNTAANSDSPA